VQHRDMATKEHCHFTSNSAIMADFYEIILIYMNFKWA